MKNFLITDLGSYQTSCEISTINNFAKTVKIFLSQIFFAKKLDYRYILSMLFSMLHLLVVEWQKKTPAIRFFAKTSMLKKFGLNNFELLTLTDFRSFRQIHISK